MAVVLQVNNISKTYGSRGNTYTALHDLSFDITEGEFGSYHRSAHQWEDLY
jgi:putative ABC transport system ATP-binding protein